MSHQPMPGPSGYPHRLGGWIAGTGMDSAPVLVAVAPAAPHHTTPHHLPSSNAAAHLHQSALINKSASIAALSPLALKKFHHNHILKTTGSCLSPKATRKSSNHSTPTKKTVTIVNNNYAMSNHNSSSGQQEMESLDDMLRKVIIIMIIIWLLLVLCVCVFFCWLVMTLLQFEREEKRTYITRLQRQIWLPLCLHYLWRFDHEANCGWSTSLFLAEFQKWSAIVYTCGVLSYIWMYISICCTLNIKSRPPSSKWEKPKQ